MSDLLSIGQVATATGLAVSAVRYYDEIGLVEAAARVGGKRCFSPDTVGRVNFVQRCQEAGFTLEEVGEVLDDTAGDWRRFVDDKVAELTARRDHIDVVLDMLREIRSCGCQVVAECPRLTPYC
ncbi:MAG: MerR family transcriptional regulator [Acidimicrobiales bacterium]